jgi:hypothetical protein
VASVLPDFADYKGLPIEFGRMAPTKSDPTAQQQYGMVVGVPNAGQLGALTTLNIRGERSVTCKGAFDAHPSTGPLPAGAPKACEAFRRQPDALERAAELDARYGRNPDLAALPMYCVVLSFKDSFDTTDMRTTSGGDVAYATDAPSHRLDDRRRTAGQGRHHLRQGQSVRIQRGQRQSWRRGEADGPRLRRRCAQLMGRPGL